MDENQTQNEGDLSKYELKKQKKEEERRQRGQDKTKKSGFKTLGIVFVSIVVLVGGGWWILSQEPQEPIEGSEIIAKKGIHWHPEISIFIKGEKMEIPANIGLGVTHSPVHTHDADGVIHLEFSGIVREDDIKLGKFFKEWDKTLNSECIFEFCNGEEGTVTVTVNGELNTEFENYIMKDGDKIEIIFGEAPEGIIDEDSSQESTSSEPEL